jgi:hypothetical protein
VAFQGLLTSRQFCETFQEDSSATKSQRTTKQNILLCNHAL